MYYFYYFQDTQTKLYYGGITDNVLRRQKQHQKQITRNLKSDKKPWYLYQDKIQLIILWSFETKSQACVYEKQWIINNYLNPLCLNCSVSNSEYDATTDNHKQLCEKGGGSKAKKFLLVNKNTKEQSQIFYGTLEPQRLGYKINQSNLNQCLLGKRRFVNGYYVALCI